MRIERIERAWGAEALRPVVGWKVWRVADGELLSVLYGDRWPLDEPVRASCRRHVHVAHEAPALGCECGIHAGRELRAWEHYLAVGAEARVLGRVMLWGTVLEGTSAWRGELARPVEILVPPAVENAEEVAEALLAYGVPVHLPAPVEQPVPA
jgi:hypothetical protein